MGIYTRRGDTGQTGMADGSRTSKASARVEALGAIDEAAAAVGLARQAVADGELDSMLDFAQQRLLNCSTTLADSSCASSAVSETDVAFLEAAIDRLSGESGGWRGFVLASGGEASTRLHLARTIARRAERRAVTLAEEAAVDPTVLSFLNRLSDLLFAAAGTAADLDGQVEELWDREAAPPRL